MDAQEKESDALLRDKNVGKLLVSVHANPRGKIPLCALVRVCGAEIESCIKAERNGVVGHHAIPLVNEE